MGKRLHGMLGILALCATAHGLYAINFNASRTYTFGDNYGGAAVVAADFNGDGKPDVAVTVYYAGTGQGAAVEIFLSQSNGGMSMTHFYALPGGSTYLSNLAAADFNGDGKIDLAVATTSGLAILLGSGDGSFAAPVLYAASGIGSVVSADFNGDGIPDLAATVGNTNSVSVWLGIGDGTFQAPVSYAVGNQPNYLAAADFNGDGKPDLAVSNSGATRPGTVSILFGAGDGTFHKAVNHTVGNNPQSIAVGDFNRDGKPDLAIVNGAGTVSVLLASGGGAFNRAVTYDAGPSPGAIAAVDLKGDGTVDLAVVNIWTSDQGPGGHTISILKGNRDGTFQAPAAYAVLAFPEAMAFADFDGDGKLDMAVASGDYTGGLTILLANTRGFHQFATVEIGAPTSSVVAADFNGDGKLDLAVATSGIAVLLGNGDGTFQPPASVAAEDGGQMLVADFNGDGKPDLAVAAPSGILIFLGNGDGTFEAPLDTGATGSPIELGDFNGDGKPDILSVPGGVTLLGNGDGTFRTVQNSISAPVIYSIATGDFDGDGKTDIAVQYQDPGEYTIFGTSIYLSAGNGMFRYSSEAGFTGLFDLIAADLNGDGKLDLAGAYGDIYMTLGMGNGDFPEPTNFAAGGNVSALRAGDFNGDGKTDLVGNGLGMVSFLLGNGDGTFQPQIDFLAGACPGEIALGDFNGDGKMDLAVADSCSNSIAILTNRTK